ncbi:MAG: HD domain-containing protein [Candidatus Pacebacteria bacterium]|jgi:uncharacterized protein|nr:HD domain-containing protein [Candidatus Paceibacterota bacterium]
MYGYFEILEKHSSSREVFEIVLRHSLEVLSKSIEIVNKKKLYDRIDFDLIISGSILHDIGTFEFLENNSSNGEYIRHGVIGAEILRKEGLQKEALIAERHTGAGLTSEEIIANGWALPHEDFLPVSLEEKIICYSDKFSSKTPGKKDTIESVEKEFERYGQSSLKRFLELKQMFE